MKKTPESIKAVPLTIDERTSDERVEDLAFENRIKVLTRDRKWAELEAVMLVYGSALDERE